MTNTEVDELAGSPSNFRQNEPEQLTLIDAENEPDLFGFDSAIRSECGVVCGIDEAGRGPLAGDVFAAAVVFDEGVFIEGLNDSKKLTEKKRESLFDEIISKARAYCIASASVEEIERLNILQADFLAMERAYSRRWTRRCVTSSRATLSLRVSRRLPFWRRCPGTDT